MLERCDNCGILKKLSHQCECGKVFYCSDRCKQINSYYHSIICEKQDCESQECEFNFDSDSRFGLCGLNNLGNTCYMNSALQCLSNCTPLTNYFINKTYVGEINLMNVLGQQGRVARSYARLLQNLWAQVKEHFHPSQFKRMMQQLNPMVHARIKII